ncbi:hypothetical protein DW054_07030 [Dorea formicigenerans]|uniref:Uncharacterized protein n=1 Tax=Dorea formicigenerans TaxID=39486 RepID=A0A415H7N0_9FIRM|nr:hypothetical protein DW054_07030 [Dorea formicigenerans]
MGIHMIVSKIKFKDLEHVLTILSSETSEIPVFCTKTFFVLTILSSETSEIPVFCTKTFLSLKKSLEDVKLWIDYGLSMIGHEEK